MEQRKRQKTESVGRDDGHDVIDLTAEGECEAVRNPEKGKIETSSLDFEFPVKLLKTRGIPEWANEGPLGFDLTEACSGAIQWALVSNFMIDMAWLASACPHLFFADQLIIVHGQKDNAPFLQSLERLGMDAEEYCVVSPDVPPYGTYHSKAFLLKYRKGMRVIIHTANLLYSDVNNKSQTAFVQDFPCKDAESPPSSDFEKETVQYVKALGLPARQLSNGIDLIQSIDFSSARGHLIASVPSKPFEYRDADRTKYGHPRLKVCLEKEPLFDKKFAGAPIVAQFSSIGNLSTNFLRGFTESLSSGRYGEQGHPLGAPAVAGIENAALCPLELVWPSVEEIRDSLEGWFAGGSIPGYPDRIRKPFLMPRYHCWDGSKAGRQRAMPHMKTYLRYDSESTEIAWICITSHNLSKAAWGEHVQSKKYKTSLFRILSYELGVLIVPSLEMAYRNHRHAGFCCDGRKSFPSGHASTAFSLGLFVCGYCLWHVAYQQRKIMQSIKKKGLARSYSFVRACVFLWVLFQLGWAWGVAISRVMDHKHHESDITAGVLLGSLVSIIFLAKSFITCSEILDNYDPESVDSEGHGDHVDLLQSEMMTRGS